MLVPEREKQQQKFQIMQRRPASSANGVAANGNGGTGNNGEAGPTSRKTLEQREAEYAQARERIFQSQTQSQSHGQNEDKAIPAESSDRNRGRQGEEDDLGPTASRFPVQRSFEPVYASLYHPPADTATTAASMGQPYDPNRGMMHQAYYSADGQYITYPQLPHGGQYADPYAMGGLHMPIPTMSMPIPPNTHSQHQPYTPAQGYDMNGQPIMLVSNGMGGYVPWGPQVQIPPAQAVPGVGGVPPPSIGIGMPLHQQRQQWAYGNPPMPLVPNGQTPYAGRSNGSNLPPPPASISSHSAFSSPTSASSFGGYSGAGSVAGPSSRQGSGTFGPVSGVGPQGQNIQPGGLGLHQHLQHPKPQRPQPTHQHSYASSSISSSSRSYQQDYPHSRPHSRGSTTSTRSAASSVRLGAMYPANAGPGYGHGHGHGHGQYGGSAYGTSQIQQQLQQPQQQQQQGGSRGKHMVREVNGLTSLNIGRERRGRGQSPVRQLTVYPCRRT